MSAKVIYTYRSKAGTKEDYIVLVDQPAEVRFTFHIVPILY